MHQDTTYILDFHFGLPFWTSICNMRGDRRCSVGLAGIVALRLVLTYLPAAIANVPAAYGVKYELSKPYSLHHHGNDTLR